MKPVIVTLAPFHVHETERLSEHFDTVVLDGANPDINDDASRLRRAFAALTNGQVGFRGELFDACPNLRLIHCLGSGYDNVDLREAQSRSIAVTTGHGLNAAAVADHALGLLLALVRSIVALDRGVRESGWVRTPSLPQLAGRKVGVLGFGAVGQAIARRLVAFDVSVGYFARRPRERVLPRFFADVTAIATWADDLIVALPSLPATRQLVADKALVALGPDGHLVNVGRGETVDTDALIRALREGGIRGAALDVVQGEPNVPVELLSLDNMILTPHVAGRSLVAREAMISLALDNIRAIQSGGPVRSVVGLG